VSEDLDASLVRYQQRGDHADERGLAAAVRPQNAHHFAALHGQGHVVHDALLFAPTERLFQSRRTVMRSPRLRAVLPVFFSVLRNVLLTLSTRKAMSSSQNGGEERSVSSVGLSRNSLACMGFGDLSLPAPDIFRPVRRPQEVVSVTLAPPSEPESRLSENCPLTTSLFLAIIESDKKGGGG